MLRAQSSKGPMDTIDRKHEQEVARQSLQPDPEGVSITSSTHPVMSEVNTPEGEKDDKQMLAGVKQDLVR